MTHLDSTSVLRTHQNWRLSWAAPAPLSLMMEVQDAVEGMMHYEGVAQNDDVWMLLDYVAIGDYVEGIDAADDDGW